MVPVLPPSSFASDDAVTINIGQQRDAVKGNEDITQAGFVQAHYHLLGHRVASIIPAEAKVCVGSCLE